MTNYTKTRGRLMVDDVAASSTPASRISVFTDSGEVQSRTPSQIRSDISAKYSSDEQVILLKIAPLADTRIVVGDDAFRFLVTKRMNITNIFVDVVSAVSGGNTVIDVVDSSLMSVLTDPLTINDGSHNNILNPSAMAVSVFNPGDLLIFNVTSVAAPTPGSGLKAYILYY